MEMRIGRILVLAISAGWRIVDAASRADDWPQWRGPHRTGISRETGLLKEWPKEGPKLVWQVKDIGYGFGTPGRGGRAASIW